MVKEGGHPCDEELPLVWGQGQAPTFQERVAPGCALGGQRSPGRERYVSEGETL